MSQNKNKKRSTKTKSTPKPAEQSTKKQQLERQQLYQAQQNIMIKRFPTELSTKEEIHRIKTLLAQCLLFVDIALEHWQVGSCMFIAPHPNRPLSEPKQQPATTTEPVTTTKPDSNNGPNHPYL